MQYNVIRNDDILTVYTFMDLKKYLDSIVTMHSIVTMQSLNTLNAGHNRGGIHKLLIQDSKCNLTIDEIKCCLKNSVLDGLKEIKIITGDERFCTINGMLYSQNTRRLYFCPRGIGDTLVIPDGTDTITEGSCGNCSFSKVIIPDSVKQIDKFAFTRNYALEYVEGCKNVERIDDYAFAYCKQLKKFSFGEFIKNIGSSAFRDTMLTEIYLPEGLSHVGIQAFNTTCIVDGIQTWVESSRMYDIHIPSTLKYIEPYAFANAANVHTPFVNASLIKACMRSGSLGNLKHCHECNTWRLKIEGKPDVIVPKSCSTKSYATSMAREINILMNKSSKDEVLTPPELYQYSTDSTGLTAALEQCRRYPNGNLRRFITRNIRIIFENLIITPLNDNGEEIMVGLIKDGVFTDTALKKILEEIEKTDERRNLITLKAYVLDTIGKNTDTFQI